jgi:hypothetical protein
MRSKPEGYPFKSFSGVVNEANGERIGPKMLIVKKGRKTFDQR